MCISTEVHLRQMMEVRVQGHAAAETMLCSEVI